MCGIRAETALRGQKLWSKLNAKGYSQETRDEASSIIFAALGDSAFCVCSSTVDDPLGMLSLLDRRYASNRASSRISLLTSLFSKKYQRGQDMAKYVDDFELMFGQLEKMGSNTALLETFKAPLLLSSLGTCAQLGSTVSALRLRDVEELSWESVTADIIQEYKRNKSSNRQQKQDGGGSSRNKKGKYGSKGGAHALQAKKTQEECSFCGKAGHSSDKCFVNPEAENCRLPQHTIDKLKGLKVEQKKSNSKKKMEFSNIAIINNAYNAKLATYSKIYLDSRASVSLFKSKDECAKESYENGSDVKIQVATGSEQEKCGRKGTLKVNSLSLKDAMHVPSLNDTLLSIGKICDNGNLVVFTKNEAVVVDLSKFTVDEENVVPVFRRDETTRLYALSGKLISPQVADDDFIVESDRKVVGVPQRSHRIIRTLHRTSNCGITGLFTPTKVS